MKSNTIKGFAAGFAAAALVFSSVTAAASGRHKVEAYRNEDIRLVYRGKEVTLKDEQGTRVFPLSYNGSTYVPIRGVSQVLGESVGWDAETYTVYIGSDDGLVSEGETYTLGSRTPFEFEPYSYEYAVFGEKYWDAEISKLAVIHSELNDKGEYLIRIQFEGTVSDIVDNATPTIGFRAIYYDAYGATVGTESVRVGASEKGYLSAGSAVITVPADAVSVGIDTSAVQSAF